MAGNSGTTPASGGTPSVSFFGNTPLTPSRSLAASTFLAGDESVTIIPSFNLNDPMELISGSVGPFRAGMDTVVPLWLASMLRRRKLAKLVPPPWMDAEVLREVLRFERDLKEQSFSPDLPFRHAEIARAILASCRAGSGTGSAGAGDGGDSEIPNADQVKILLEDIATVRMDKIRRNVHQLSSSMLKERSKIESIIDVTNIGSMEMHAVKPFVAESFRMHRELSGKGSSYSRDVEPDNNANPRSGGGGSSGGRAAAASAGRGRLRQSRLARTSENAEREEEELMEPQPMEDNMEEEEEEEQIPPEAEEDDEPMDDLDANAGRSRLRRHR